MSIASQLSFSRVRAIAGGSSGTVVYQTGTNYTGFISTGTVGTILVNDGTGQPVWDNKLALDNTTPSTSTTTGALLVKGGVGIAGKVYADTGNPDENYMLYTPKTTVSDNEPVNSRIGDIWVNPNGPFGPTFFKYLLDNGSKIWVQVS